MDDAGEVDVLMEESLTLKFAGSLAQRKFCSCKMIHMNESCHTLERVMAHMWTSHVTHMNMACHTYISPMSRGYEILLNEDMNSPLVK